MKKLFLIIILLWQCATINAQTSVYHEFPDSNAIWNVSWNHSGLQDCGTYTNSIASNDTLIKAISYHKIIRKTFNKTIFTPNPNSQIQYPPGYFSCQYDGSFVTSYIAGIREDVPQKKVYIIPAGDSISQLLYDFNLNVGDTLKGYLNFCNGCKRVISFDSILINSVYRKRWTFSNSFDATIIEGIGCSDGLFEISDGFEYNSSLDCFSQNNQTLYPDYDSVFACDVKVNLISVPEKKKLENEIFIYPNPSNGKFQVKLNNMKAKSLEIIDVFGNKILELEIKNAVFEINITNQPEGIYYVKILIPMVIFL